MATLGARPSGIRWGRPNIHYGSRVPRSEKIGYAVAVVILVVGGAFVKTAILNWISGPAIVVGSVVICSRLFGRFDRELPASDRTDA
ncbi:MAG: hypothetical protein EBY80_10745 [Actinobacteria bacterium]|nr:hypothetical protein [Actinomycetota bacterium]